MARRNGSGDLELTGWETVADSFAVTRAADNRSQLGFMAGRASDGHLRYYPEWTIGVCRNMSAGRAMSER